MKGHPMIRMFLMTAALGLAACTPPAAEKVEAPAPAVEQDSHEGPRGWMAADDAGMPGVAFAAGPNAQLFTLACGDEQQMLYVTAAPPVDLTEPGQKVTFMIGETKFEGIANMQNMAAEVLAPLTPQIMKALANADSAKLMIGEAVTDTGPGGAAELKAFAGRCETYTGVKPAP
jgi:hypothetical protein